MTQTFHIFRKDVMHQWRDLVMYAVLLVAFAVVIPQSWMGAANPNPMLAILAVLLKVWIPIMWLVIIARLVHDECLVGDQQFWVTRPYSRASLLGAKLLFVAVCVVVPFMAMQWALLLQAGLNPVLAMGGQLKTLAYFVLIVLLPFLVVAAVTRTLASTFMTLLGVVIVWAAVLALFVGGAGPRTSSPYIFETSAVVFGGVLVAVLVYQYASRDTTRARMTLIAVALVFLLWTCCFSNMWFVGPINFLIQQHYPVQAGSPLKLVFDGSSDPNVQDRGLPRSGPFAFDLPAKLEGMEPAARLRDASVMYSIDGPNYHYVSPWQPVVVSESGLSVVMSRKAFEPVHGVPVHMHMMLGAERLMPDAPEVVTATDRFKAPNGGQCTLDTGMTKDNLICRYAFEGPLPTSVRGNVIDAPWACAKDAATHSGGGVIHEVPTGTKPDPVVEEPVRMGGAVCPGTALTFVVYRPAGRFRVELDVPSVVLDAYIAH
jgi:hypothetical protein